MFGNKNNQNIGKLGEGIALNYLIKNNYKILNTNYRRKSDEIDIIARSKNGTLVFFEVKSFTTGERSNGLNSLRPEDNLTKKKFRKISRTCEFFTRQYPELVDEEKGWQIDLLAIDIGPNGQAAAIRHYEII